MDIATKAQLLHENDYIHERNNSINIWRDECGTIIIRSSSYSLATDITYTVLLERIKQRHQFPNTPQVDMEVIKFQESAIEWQRQVTALQSKLLAIANAIDFDIVDSILEQEPYPIIKPKMTLNNGELMWLAETYSDVQGYFFPIGGEIPDFVGRVVEEVLGTQYTLKVYDLKPEYDTPMNRLAISAKRSLL